MAVMIYFLYEVEKAGKHSPEMQNHTTDLQCLEKAPHHYKTWWERKRSCKLWWRYQLDCMVIHEETSAYRQIGRLLRVKSHNSRNLMQIFFL